LNRKGQRFGFLRYLDVLNIRALEKQLDSIWIWVWKLYVNVERYRQQERERFVGSSRTLEKG